MALIFLLFGPKQIPSMARAAKVIKQIRNANNDIKRDIMNRAEDEKLTEVENDESRDAFKEVWTLSKGNKALTALYLIGGFCSCYLVVSF